MSLGVWFNIAPHSVVDKLMVSRFADRFKREIFSSEQSVVPWNSPQVALLTRTEQSKNAHDVHNINYKTENQTEQVTADTADLSEASIVYAAR